MLKYYDITVCHEIEQSIGKHLYLITWYPIHLQTLTWLLISPTVSKALF